MSIQNKNINFRISEELINEYKIMCSKNGFTASSRIKLLMKFDIDMANKDKNLIKIMTSDNK